MLDWTTISTKQKWSPEYKTPDNHLFSIDSEPIQECPVSYVSAHTRTLIDQLERVEFASDATRSSMYGASLAEWPPWAVEVSIAVQSEKNKYENAKHEAARAHAPKKESPDDYADGEDDPDKVRRNR